MRRSIFGSTANCGWEVTGVSLCDKIIVISARDSGEPSHHWVEMRLLFHKPPSVGSSGRSLILALPWWYKAFASPAGSVAFLAFYPPSLLFFNLLAFNFLFISLLKTHIQVQDGRNQWTGASRDSASTSTRT
jgi:hypothetical protein